MLGCIARRSRVAGGPLRGIHIIGVANFDTQIEDIAWDSESKRILAVGAGSLKAKVR